MEEEFKIEASPNCCDIWPEFARKFNWFSFQDNPAYLTMPFITSKDGRNKWRVNFCPSCGKEIRNFIAERSRIEAGQ